MASISSNIVSYNSDHSYYSISNASQGYANSTSSNYATVNMTRGSGATTYIYWEFSLSSIPTTATINSISCNYRAGVSSTSTRYIASATIQMCSGTTTKGSSKSIMSTSPSATSFSSSEMGTWTAAEINAGVKLKTVATRGTSSTNSNYAIRFYGADITVTYTEQQIVHVVSVSLDLNSKTIEEEESFQLTETVSPSNATDSSVSWSTSSSSIATVSNGLVTGVSPGTATITVTTTDGSYTDTCTVTVTAAQRTDYEIATTMEPGKSYIVASGNSGSIYMMSNVSGGSRTLTGVPITVTNGKISLTAAQEAKCLFNCIEYTSGNSITTTLESNGSYLYCDNSSGLRFQTSSSLDRFWHYNSNKFWQFKNSTADGYDDTSTEYKYYLQITNGNFTDNHVTSTSIEDSNLPAIYLFTLASSDKLFIKKSGSWVQVNKIYKKVNGSWTEVALDTLTTPQLYVKG